MYVLASATGYLAFALLAAETASIHSDNPGWFAAGGAGGTVALVLGIAKLWAQYRGKNKESEVTEVQATRNRIDRIYEQREAEIVRLQLALETSRRQNDTQRESWERQLGEASTKYWTEFTQRVDLQRRLDDCKERIAELENGRP